MTKLLPLACCLALLTACEQKTDTSSENASQTNNYSSGNPVTAPVDYLGAVSKAKINSETKIDLSSTQNAINLFVAAEGRNPKDLNELVEQSYLPAIPQLPAGRTLRYDAAKATVTVEDAK